MDDLTLTKPVACTPTSPAQRADTAHLKAELAPHVMVRARLENGVRLRFASSPALLAKIDKLVTLDQGCCAYLEHHVDRDAEAITWTVQSAGEGIPIAQRFLSEAEPAPQNSKKRTRLKVFALVGACGLACSAPLLLGVLGIGAASISLAAVGKELAVLALIAVGVSGYFVYTKKKRATAAKGKTDANRCGC